jgi:hypothetical protein
MQRISFNQKILTVAVVSTFAVMGGVSAPVYAGTVYGGGGLVASLTQTLGLGSAVTAQGSDGTLPVD